MPERLLEPGMVLLDCETYSTPHVWTVTRVAQKSATVIAHYGTCHAEAKLRTPRLPEGWRIIEHHPLARLLADDWSPADRAAALNDAELWCDRYREALERIRAEGKVCANYETCEHVACQSSYAAWAIADEVLASAASGDPKDDAPRRADGVISTPLTETEDS